MKKRPLLIIAAVFGAATFGFAIQPHDHGANEAPAARQSSAGKAEAEALAKARAEYPLQICAVSTEELGSMGEPFEHIHKQAGKPDRLVRMCCKGCLKTFNKAPAKYLARIDAAAKKQAGKATGGSKAPAGHHE